MLAALKPSTAVRVAIAYVVAAILHITSGFPDNLEFCASSAVSELT